MVTKLGGFLGVATPIQFDHGPGTEVTYFGVPGTFPARSATKSVQTLTQIDAEASNFIGLPPLLPMSVTSAPALPTIVSYPPTTTSVIVPQIPVQSVQHFA